MSAKGIIRKVVLAYSGGLDTSIILKWLIEEYGCEVIAFSADLGQGEELDFVPEKARNTGARSAMSKTCARSSSVTSSSPYFEPTPSTRDDIFSAPPSPGR